MRVRFAPTHGTLASRAGHIVRTVTERVVCDWLTEHGFEHRHAGDVYIVKAPANGSPVLFVPDIILAEKTAKDGKTIIIETVHNFAPKRGGLRAFAAFCKQYRGDFHTILIARSTILKPVPRQPCDASIALENLDLLQKRLEKLIGRSTAP